MAVFWIILSLLLLLTVLMFIPSLLSISFVWNENERKLKVEFKYLFFKIVLTPRKKKVKKTKEKTNDKKYTLDDVRKFYKTSKEIYSLIKEDVFKILEYAKDHAVKISRIDLDAQFDIEDSMKTGIVTGVINGTVYNAIGVLDNLFSVDDFNVKILPLFNNTNFFDIKAYGIVNIKNVHIMVIIFKILKVFLKIKKNKKV